MNKNEKNGQNSVATSAPMIEDSEAMALAKEEVSKAVAEAIENAINGIRYSSGRSNKANWIESDFNPIYGYGYSVMVRVECDGKEDKIIFKLYKYDLEGNYKKITSITTGLYTWGDMEKLNGIYSVAEFFASFINEKEG